MVLVGCGPSVPDISIHEAVQDGNIEAVKQHLAAGTDVNGTDVNAMNRHRNSLLQMAALMGHQELLELLIVKGADVNTRSNVG